MTDATKADLTKLAQDITVETDAKLDSLSVDLTQQINDVARVIMEASTAINVDIRQAYKALFHDVIIEKLRSGSSDPVGEARAIASEAYPPPPPKG